MSLTNCTFTLVLCAGLLASGARPSFAQDLFALARQQAEQASARASAEETGANILNVRSAAGQTASSRTLAYLYSDTASATPGAVNARLELPAQQQPWGWSWFPFYQASLVFWRPSQAGGVEMSALEKLDTFVFDRGGAEPFAAGFEASDSRPWIAAAQGLPAGHNLTRAVAEAGNQTTVPWFANGATSQMDVSWWGHCNGWAAASVLFPESRITGRQVTLQRKNVRVLKRPEFLRPAADLSPFRPSGGLAGLYQHVGADSMYFYAEDLKSILTEWGMQLRPVPGLSAGRRYDAPSVDVDEYFFERRSDGTVVVPTDAQIVWVAMVMDGKTVGGWMVPPRYPEDQLRTWRVQIEQYYRYYYPGRQIYTMLTARYTNLPLAPTAEDLAHLPPLVRKGFLDVDPLDFHAKLSQALSGQGGQTHGMIVEVSAGSQVWNFPVKSYAYSFSGTGETWHNPQSVFSGATSSDPSAAFNLARLDPRRLEQRNGRPVLRYRIGTMKVTLQKVSTPYDENYQFIVFYGPGDSSIGATWLGESAAKHPDFIWYPDMDNVGSDFFVNPYVRSADIKALAPELGIR